MLDQYGFRCAHVLAAQITRGNLANAQRVFSSHLSEKPPAVLPREIKLARAIFRHRAFQVRDVRLHRGTVALAPQHPRGREKPNLGRHAGSRRHFADKRVVLVAVLLVHRVQILKTNEGRRHQQPAVQRQQVRNRQFSQVRAQRRRQIVHFCSPSRDDFMERRVVDQAHVERVAAFLDQASNRQEQVRLVHFIRGARPERFPVTRIFLELHVNPQNRFFAGR